MSRTIKIAKAGGPEVLEFIDAPVRAPGPHEVQIEIREARICDVRIDGVRWRPFHKQPTTDETHCPRIIKCGLRLCLNILSALFIGLIVA